MNKRLAAVLFLSLLLCGIFVMSGCSESNSYVDAWNEGVANYESQIASDQVFRDQFVKPYFEKVAEDSEYNFVLYRDLLTDVMYVSYVSSNVYGRGVAYSVMYATDGTPLLYSEWLALGVDQEVPGND